MNIGIIGLGRMGSAIAHRLIQHKFNVWGYDPYIKKVEISGIHIASTITMLAEQVQTVWLLIPAGQMVTDTITHLSDLLPKESTVIDAGNSHFSDALKHAEILQKKNIQFLDCGTSGGIHGKENGFCLMIGGNKDVYKKIETQLQAVAQENGYAHVGPTSTGHLVKMVHNGIEYGIMQAYAEGLSLLKTEIIQNHTLDLEKITGLWSHGSIIRSWLLELTNAALKKHGQSLEHLSGMVESNGMGQWTVDRAEQKKVSVDVIKIALQKRYESVKNGGDYASKLVALMRNEFGGHRFFTTNNDKA